MNGNGTVSKRRVLPSQLQRGQSLNSSKFQQSSAQAIPPNGNVPYIVLLPLNDTFDPKTIVLPHLPDVVKIGRQTNKSTVPYRDNGFFDSKVLSRSHAEIWANAEGRACIKDIRSSNGTFVNGIRLSKENEESEVRELLPGDTLELGIDILNDDNGTIIHRKVSARVDHAGYQAEGYTSGQNGESSRGQYGLNSNGLPTPPMNQGNGDRSLSYDNIRAGSTASLSSLASQHTHVSAGRNHVTIDMVINKLNHDLKISKQVATDLKHTTEIFRSGTSTKTAQPGHELSPFRSSARSSNFTLGPLNVKTASEHSEADDSRLDKIREELSTQTARVHELESSLMDEREARMLIEEKWRTMIEVPTKATLEGDDGSSLSSTSTIRKDFSADHEVPNGMDEVSDSNGGGVVERMENLLRSAQEEMALWKARAEAAEQENITKDSRILELVADLQRARQSEQDASKSRGRSSSPIELSTVDGKVLSRENKKSRSLKGGPSETDSIPSPSSPSATDGGQHGGRGTALVSMVGMVMLGLGLMTFLNDYGPKKD